VTMRNALSRESKMALARLMAAGPVLAFDFDGTLAPIVDDPKRARMRPLTRRLLRRLAEDHPCVVISGRARADLERRLEGIGVKRIVGNHGAEPWDGEARARQSVEAWSAALAPAVAPFRGVHIENKGASLTVHYRRARAKARARACIVKAAQGLKGARLLPGKLAVSLTPRDAPDKGAALCAELARTGRPRALYVGDDATDEDVFALSPRRGVMTVRVGRSVTSRARYFLRGQAEMDELLRALLALAPRPTE